MSGPATWLSIKRWMIGVPLILLSGCNGSDSVTEPTPVVVTPSGFSLTGVVRDTASRYLQGARVEVVEGTGAGASALADGQGGFFLAGPFSGTVTLQASHTGHITATRLAMPSSRGGGPQPVFFWLETTTPTVDVAGEYVLTLEADSSCTQLPDVARSRRYPTTLTRTALNSPHEYRAILSGATFFQGFLSNSFYVGVAGDFVRAEIDFDGIGITEEVAPSTYVAVVGWADAHATSSSIAGPLAGWFEYCASSTPASGSVYRCPSTAVFCQSSNHRFSLARR